MRNEFALPGVLAIFLLTACEEPTDEAPSTSLVAESLVVSRRHPSGSVVGESRDDYRDQFVPYLERLLPTTDPRRTEFEPWFPESLLDELTISHPVCARILGTREGTRRLEVQRVRGVACGFVTPLPREGWPRTVEFTLQILDNPRWSSGVDLCFGPWAKTEDLSPDREPERWKHQLVVSFANCGGGLGEWGGYSHNVSVTWCGVMIFQSGVWDPAWLPARRYRVRVELRTPDALGDEWALTLSILDEASRAFLFDERTVVLSATEVARSLLEVVKNDWSLSMWPSHNRDNLRAVVSGLRVEYPADAPLRSEIAKPPEGWHPPESAAFLHEPESDDSDAWLRHAYTTLLLDVDPQTRARAIEGWARAANRELSENQASVVSKGAIVSKLLGVVPILHRRLMTTLGPSPIEHRAPATSHALRELVKTMHATRARSVESERWRETTLQVQQCADLTAAELGTVRPR